MTARPLRGLRVIVVEDEAVLEMALEDMLTTLGCIVAGTAMRMRRARDLVATIAFDLAVLDINIAGERVDPVADELARRGVPFVFATGYGEAGVAPHFKSRPIVHKPYSERELEATLLQAWTERLG